MLDGEVEDRVVQVTDAVAVVADPPALYLRLVGEVPDGPETVVLTGDYLTRLRRTGCFPSTTLRLIQLPKSRAVVGVLPMGDVLHPPPCRARTIARWSSMGRRRRSTSSACGRGPAGELASGRS